VGQLKAPFPQIHGTREGSPFMPEELTFQQILRQSATIHGDEGLVAPGAVEVDGAGNQFLAGARFSGDEHRSLGRGHFLNELVDALHGSALADNASELVAFLQFTGEITVSFDQLIVVDRFADGELQLLILEGFKDIVECSFAHGFDGFFHRSVGGHHDNGKIGMLEVDPFEQCHAVHARHSHVSDDRIQLIFRDYFQTALAGFGCHHLVTLLTEEIFEDQQIVLFVIDNEDAFHTLP